MNVYAALAGTTRGIIFQLILLSALLFGASGTGLAGTEPDSTVMAKVNAMSEIMGFEIETSYHRETGLVNFLRPADGYAITSSLSDAAGATVERIGRAFLSDYGSIFGIRDQNTELELMKTTSADNGSRFVRFQQVYRDIPVFGGELIVGANTLGGISSVNGEMSSVSGLEAAPGVSAEKAGQTALRAAAGWYGVDDSRLTATDPELWIYNPALISAGSNMNHLVWRTEVSTSGGRPIRELVLIDAQNGLVSLHFNQVANVLDRLVYDLNNERISYTEMPGTEIDLKCSDTNTGCTADSSDDAQKAYEFSGDTYNFYADVHGRDGIDDAGMTIISSVKYCPDDESEDCPYVNAAWIGDQMIFGDGLVVRDVMGHELTHGVTQYTSSLFYFAQSGAINESFSDIWGEFIDQTYDTDKPESERWLIGEDVPSSLIDGFAAMRDMKDPTSTLVSSQGPDRVSSDLYWCDTADQAGVHTNCGVFNKAAYLMTDGGSFNGYEMEGLGITKTADIFYHAQTNLLVSGADFNDLYEVLLTSCSNLTGTNGITDTDCEQVQKALNAVEANQIPADCGVLKTEFCALGNPTNLFYDDFESGSSNWMVDGEYWDVVGPNSQIGYAKSGVYSLAGGAGGGLHESEGAMSLDVTLPEQAYLFFDHAYLFHTDSGVNYAGGVVEYSLDSGETWQDAGGIFSDGGYNGTVGGEDQDNPLTGSEAFVDTSYGYTTARLSLESLSGQKVRFRFRIGSDTTNEDSYWFVDNVRVYTCDGGASSSSGSSSDNGCFINIIR